MLNQALTSLLGGSQVDKVKVEVALQWCSDSFSDTMLGFVNSIKTVDGGTHMDGFKAALTRTVNSLGRKSKVLKDGDANLSGDHIREGLGAIVSVKVGAPNHSVLLSYETNNRTCGFQNGLYVCKATSKR